MAGSEIRAVTAWQTVSRFYRRPLGRGWWVALATIPLLLAFIGHGGAGRPGADHRAPAASGPALSAPAEPAATAVLPTVTAPELSFAPLAVLRNGGVVTLNGDLPDDAARNVLLERLGGVFGPGIRLVDNITLKPGVTAPDSAGLAAVFKAGLTMTDLKLQLNHDTVTLTGTAGTDAEKAAVQAAAAGTWPTSTISNQIRVAEAPPGPPAPGPAGHCAGLQADITALMHTPVTFDLNGHTLTADSKQQLGRVAQKLAGCRDARIAVNAYTDNTGSDAVNKAVSANRAAAVADYLVAQGVPADHITATGFGSADPVASNATAEGRAQNRRVLIVVD